MGRGGVGGGERGLVAAGGGGVGRGGGGGARRGGGRGGGGGGEWGWECAGGGWWVCGCAVDFGVGGWGRVRVGFLAKVQLACWRARMIGAWTPTFKVSRR